MKIIIFLLLLFKLFYFIIIKYIEILRGKKKVESN